MTRYLTHFESPIDGTIFPCDQVQTMHRQRPILAKYDMASVASAWSKNALSTRPWTIWRYRELLPIGDEIDPVSLDEGVTPLIRCDRLAESLSLRNLWIKDESRLPGNTFKARGLALAITMARHFGFKHVAMASNGNAGSAMAIYAARAGLQSTVVMPKDTPRSNLLEAYLSGARVYVADGMIDQCGRAIRQEHDRGTWFDISTMKEPYRIEGKKTMGFEIAEQFQWKLPDVIIYPTGGGTAMIAMWRAFQELAQLNWLSSKKMPRMVAVQSTGCAPIVKAFEKRESQSQRCENAKTVAAGLRVPLSIGDFLVLNALYESNGLAIAAEEERIVHWQNEIARLEGLVTCPEAAVCLGALIQLVERKLVSPDEHIVIFNTSAGNKYIDHVPLDIPTLDLDHVDWSKY